MSLANHFFRYQLEIPDDCQKELELAYTTGKLAANANTIYGQMNDICGISFQNGTFEDFQRFFRCQNMKSPMCNDKGLQFPSTCSVPPCNQCSHNQRKEKLNNINSTPIK